MTKFRFLFLRFYQFCKINLTTSKYSWQCVVNSYTCIGIDYTSSYSKISEYNKKKLKSRMRLIRMSTPVSIVLFS